MSRLPYAARTLIAQVRAAYPDAAYEPGETDGFGVYRRIGFGPDVSAWLAPLLDRVLDWRLLGAEMDEGLLTLYFDIGPAADDSSEWLLPPPPPR